jgi:hypothetical protein
MPHLFTNRQRLLGLLNEEGDLRGHFVWETVNAILYKVGGVSFIFGSIFFFPDFGAYEDVGAWIFFTGSLLYLIVTGHDMAEVIRHRKTLTRRTRAEDLEVVAATAYLLGTVLFAIGSIFFLSEVGLFVDGAWLFVFGSALFALGACVNVLQIAEAHSMLILQLMNLTAIAFVVGSVLFLVASVPYLWRVESAADRTTLYAFLAWQYLTGSALFLLGGFFNYWRAWTVMKQATAGR